MSPNFTVIRHCVHRGDNNVVEMQQLRNFIDLSRLGDTIRVFGEFTGLAILAVLAYLLTLYLFSR